MSTTPYRSFVTLSVLLVFLAVPFVSFAQSDEGEYSRERVSGWRRQSREMQKKIDALGDTQVSTIPIPVLFGVELKNIFPNFGDSRGDGSRTHEGEDIMALKGTPVVSPTKAVVLRTGKGTNSGNYVYTANPGGETFIYMHFDRIGEDVSAGDVLEVGSLIGYVGNTGNASGGAAHLHLEIRKDGPTDPYPRIKKEFTLEEKIKYLTEMLDHSDESDTLAEFLVKNFRSTFIQASRTAVLPIDIIKLLASESTGVSTGGGGTPLVVRNLYSGIVGSDVQLLQQLLNANGFIVASSGAGSQGSETTYFGSATEAAVIKFQIARNIKPSVGYVGPLTRAALATLAGR